MDETHLYQQIATEIRQEILTGKLKPGDRVLSVRAMAARWGCTAGTVQRAYGELVQQGLITSRAGQGTRVVDQLPPQQDETPLRRATLIHRAEAFLLEVLTTGYSLPEVDRAVREAMDRWRTVVEQPPQHDQRVLRFAGSHDLALTWAASQFPDLAPGYTLQLRFAGSLGGLIALAEGRADLAGCHLWDRESDTYNLPFVRRLLPGRRTALVTLAHRRLGLILPPGNPRQVHGLEDLLQPGLRFVNRQSGSGTRVWLDSILQATGIPRQQIQGYTDERATHSAVALAIAEGQADAGLGLEAAADSYGLDFVLLTLERYDLALLNATLESNPAQALVKWLNSARTKAAIEKLGGYETRQTGQIQWVGD